MNNQQTPNTAMVWLLDDLDNSGLLEIFLQTIDYGTRATAHTERRRQLRVISWALVQLENDFEIGYTEDQIDLINQALIMGLMDDMIYGE